MTVLKSITSTIYNDLKKRFPEQRDTQRRKLSELSAAVMLCKSPNLMEISNVLDRPTTCANALYNYVERFLKNPLVDHKAVMAPFAKDLLTRLAKAQHTVVLMIDQSKINADMEAMVISVRLKKRALPLHWCIQKTSGNIGFDHQKELLETVASWAQGMNIMLAGDRFYGTKALVGLCQSLGWGYRLRLKGNTQLEHEGGLITPMEAHHLGMKSLENVRFNDTDIPTHLGILHENGHPEPWFIAMDVPPTTYRTLDYAMRWGIENMFSDFKSRGFDITQTQIKNSDRLERLFLVITIAFHWVVSTGLSCKKKEPIPSMKSPLRKNDDPVSLFLKWVCDASFDAWRSFKNHLLYSFIVTDGW